MMAQRCIIYNFFNSHFLIENTIWFSFGVGKFRARTKFKASSICINVFYNGHKNYLLDTHGISYDIGELNERAGNINIKVLEVNIVG